MNYVNNGKIRLATEQSLVKAAKTQPMFGRNSYDVIVSMLVSFFEVNSSPCVVHFKRRAVHMLAIICTCDLISMMASMAWQRAALMQLISKMASMTGSVLR